MPLVAAGLRCLGVRKREVVSPPARTRPNALPKCENEYSLSFPGCLRGAQTAEPRRKIGFRAARRAIFPRFVNDQERTVASFEAQPLPQALEVLVRQGRRWKKGEPVRLPGVTLHLASGRDVEGVIVDAVEQHGQTTYVFSPLGGPRRGDLMLVPLGAIEVVSLHEPGALTKTNPALEAVAPSMQQLERRARSLEEQLAAVGSLVRVELPRLEEGPARAALGQLLEALAGALALVTATEAGREGLRRLDVVVVAVEPSALVARTERRLHVSTRLHEPWTPEALKVQLDGAL